MMKFVSALSLGGDQPGRLENVKMLRDTLARHADLVFHHEARAQLEECLAVAIA